MPNTQTEKPKANIIVEILEYVPGSVVYKTVIKKQSGTINTTTFDTKDGFPEKVSPYDNFVQVVEGSAKIAINGKVSQLGSGQGIMIAAHQAYTISSDVRFKIIMTIIKNEMHGKALAETDHSETKEDNQL